MAQVATRGIAELERRLTAEQYVDLAVKLRVLDPDGEPGRLLPQTFGGRWDRVNGLWVRPQPLDLDVEEWSVQEQQLDLLLHTPKEKRLVALFAGRQAGKTRAGVMDVLLDALRSPGRAFGIVSLNYKSSREPEQTFLSLLSPKWQVRPRKADRWWNFPTGARVIFRSWEAIDSLRGPSLKKILLDEAAYMKEAAYITALGCGVAAKDFRLLLATTPKRECTWVRDKAEEWGRDPASKICRLRSEDNPRADRAFLERLKAELPADLYRQEFEGEVVPPQHAVYYLYARKVHEREEPRLGDVTREFCREHFGVAASLLMGWDFGQEAVVIGKIFRDSYVATGADGKRRTVTVDRLWIVGEEVAERTTTEHHAGVVASKWGTDAVVITDAMGAHDRGMPGRTTAAIRLLRDAGFLKVRPVAEANPDIEQRVRTVLRLLRSTKRTPADPDGEVRFYHVPTRTPRLREALENQEMDGHGKPQKDGRLEHVADALGYLVYASFPIRGEAPDGFSSHRSVEARP